MFVKITKIIVQLYVENLLKVLKVLKTRTALKRNGFSRVPHTLHTAERQGAFKTKDKTDYQYINLIYQLKYLTIVKKYAKI